MKCKLLVTDSKFDITCKVTNNAQNKYTTKNYKRRKQK